MGKKKAGEKAKQRIVDYIINEFKRIEAELNQKVAQCARDAFEGKEEPGAVKKIRRESYAEKRKVFEKAYEMLEHSEEIEEGETPDPAEGPYAAALAEAKMRRNAAILRYLEEKPKWSDTFGEVEQIIRKWESVQKEILTRVMPVILPGFLPENKKEVFAADDSWVIVDGPAPEEDEQKEEKKDEENDIEEPQDEPAPEIAFKEPENEPAPNIAFKTPENEAAPRIVYRTPDEQKKASQENDLLDKPVKENAQPEELRNRHEDKKEVAGSAPQNEEEVEYVLPPFIARTPIMPEEREEQPQPELGRQEKAKALAEELGFEVLGEEEIIQPAGEKNPVAAEYEKTVTFFADRLETVEKTPETAERLKRIAEGLKTLSGEAKRQLYSETEPQVSEQTIRTVRENAKALYDGGIKTNLIADLTKLGSPAEEYELNLKRQTVVRFRMKLEGIEDRLRRAKTVFSNNSAEYDGMLLVLGKLRKVVSENPALLGGSRYELDFETPEFTAQLGRLRKSAVNYFGKKLAQDKNENRRIRFGIAEEIMKIKGIADAEEPKKDVKAVNIQQKDLFEMATLIRRADLQKDEDAAKLCDNAEKIRRLAEEMPDAPEDGPEKQKALRAIRGAALVCELLQKEREGWETVKKKDRASEEEVILAKRDVILGQGIRNLVSGQKAEKRLSFYASLADNAQKLDELKNDMLQRKGVTNIVRSINAKDDAVKKAFTPELNR